MRLRSVEDTLSVVIMTVKRRPGQDRTKDRACPYTLTRLS